MLRGGFASRAVGDLLLRIHACQEQLTMLVDHLSDTYTLGDVGADAVDSAGHTAR